MTPHTKRTPPPQFGAVPDSRFAAAPGNSPHRSGGSAQYNPVPPTAKRPAKPGLVSRLIALISEVLLTLGMLVILFVVWELWWTGIGAENDRQESMEDFYDQLDVSSADQGPQGPDVDTCYTLDDGTEIGCAPAMRELTGPEDIMAALYAPRLGDDWVAPVRAGVSAYQIDRGGVGHYLTTEWPDEPGNFAVAGHRNTYSSMLGDQDLLEHGDRLYLVSSDGMWIYEVNDRKIVLPHQNEVLYPDPDDTSVAETDSGILTLTTCHPMFSNTERLIHHAEIVDFIPLGGGVPDELSHHDQVVEAFAADEAVAAGEDSGSQSEGANS